MTERARVIGQIADHLNARRPGHVLRVAVDGVTGAGKTTLAGELGAAIRDRGRPAIQLTMDGFHHPRQHRYRQGRDSAVGYYRDAYDHARFASTVLEPLGPGGSGAYVPAILDLASDEVLHLEPIPAEPDAVLLVDGTFLQSPSLAGYWDEVLFLDTELDAARARGVGRDSAAFGSSAAAEAAYRSRYHAACLLYLDEVNPEASASVVLDNTVIDHPVLRRIGRPTP